MPFSHMLFSRPSAAYSKPLISLFLVVGLSLGVFLAPLDAQAAKKKKDNGPNEAELQKGLEPLNTDLNKLLVKTQSRYLFTPEDSGQLADIKFKLLDFMKDYPKSTLLVKPAYQAGVLFTQRELFNDAYELFGFLSANFPEDPYGKRAYMEIEQLRKRLGNNYFPDPPAPPQAADAAAPADKGADKAAAKK